MEAIKRFMCNHACQPLTGWPIALMRIATGAMFIMPGWRKVSMGADWAPRMEGFVNRHLEAGNVYGFYKPFLEGVVMKMPVLFAAFVAWGELLIGIALVVGAFTRLSAFLGAFMLASFLFTKGHSVTFWAANNYDTIWVLIFLMLAFTGAGRVFGVDRLFVTRFGDKRWLW